MTYIPNISTLRVMKVINGVKHYYENGVLVHTEGSTSLSAKIGMAVDSAVDLVKSGAATDTELGEQRLSTCEKCPVYNKEKQLCTNCGCFMPVKVKFVAMKCPLQNWEK